MLINSYMRTGINRKMKAILTVVKAIKQVQLQIHCLPLLVIGGKLVYLYTKKPGKVPKCGDCKTKLQGVSRYSFSSKNILSCSVTGHFLWVALHSIVHIEKVLLWWKPLLKKIYGQSFGVKSTVLLWATGPVSSGNLPDIDSHSNKVMQLFFLSSVEYQAKVKFISF